MMRTQVLLKLAAWPIKLLEFKLGTEKIQTQQIDKPLNLMYLELPYSVWWSVDIFNYPNYLKFRLWVLVSLSTFLLFSSLIQLGTATLSSSEMAGPIITDHSAAQHQCRSC